MPFPSKRSPELEDEILSRLAQGEPLAQICRSPGMPTPNGFRDWTKADEALGIAYARAREDGFDQIANDCLEIADDKSRDTRVVGEDEREVCDTEWVARSKLRIETRLKLLAKWDPKRFGDKLDINHRGTVASANVPLPDDPNEAARVYREMMQGIEGE